MVRISDDYGEVGTMTRWASLGESWANVGNTPFRYYKNFSYEGGINTPFIAYWPGKIQPSSFSEFPGHFIDIMSTLVDITGAQYPEVLNDQEITPMQGQSLLPVFKGGKMEREKPLFWEWSDGKAVFSNSWKIVKEGKESPWDLYHLADDPTETQNLANEHPQKVRQLDQLFSQWKSTLPTFEN